MTLILLLQNIQVTPRRDKRDTLDGLGSDVMHGTLQAIFSFYQTLPIRRDFEARNTVLCF